MWLPKLDYGRIDCSEISICGF
ncbi:BnaCnng78520D [Brassica napus]|uniref:BnaCnng78520D protein n=1 Tax=Brassica napus TaxID=3708 RepID=A0A078K1G3_BRANA|nr:BnaCnng78520D [Brassica napus]